jgi:hypothetical protein
MRGQPAPLRICKIVSTHTAQSMPLGGHARVLLLSVLILKVYTCQQNRTDKVDHNRHDN